MDMCNDATDKPIGFVMAIRAGKVVHSQALVESNDILSAYPAISGWRHSVWKTTIHYFETLIEESTYGLLSDENRSFENS